MIEIKNDVYNIAKRIKNIDKDFSIYFDKLKSKFYVCENAKGCIMYSLSFDCLDCRTLNYVLEMQKKSNNEILLEVENYNKKLDKINNEKIIESAIMCAEKVLRRS